MSDGRLLLLMFTASIASWVFVVGAIVGIAWVLS